MGILSAISSGDPIQIVLYLLTISILLFFVMPVHECAHGVMAKILGDDTAERAGRLTLNPMAHLDMTGALCMLLVGFGWANPVPVNPIRFNNQKRRQGYMALVAAAGPLSNLLMSIIWLIVYRTLLCFNMPDIAYECIGYVCPLLIFMNVGLAVFNMIPIGPLDGAKIFNWIIPDKILYKVQYTVGRKLSGMNPIVYLLVFWIFIRLISGPLGALESWLVNVLFRGINSIYDAIGIGFADNYIQYLFK